MKVVIILLTYFVGLNGILFETRIDHNKPLNWKNLNTLGHFLIIFLTVIIALSVSQELTESRENKKRIKELSDFNKYLLKAIAIGKGYDVVTQGFVIYNNPVSEKEIRASLSNMFIKGAEVEIIIRNKYGKFSSLVSYSNQPEIKKFLKAEKEFDSTLIKEKIKTSLSEFVIFFELRFSGITILNDDKIPYVKDDSTDNFFFLAVPQNLFNTYQRIYKVKCLVFSEIIIEELGFKQTFPIKPIYRSVICAPDEKSLKTKYF